MSSKTSKAYLHDILSEIERLKKFTSKFKDEKQFAKNIQAVYACSRSIEIIGEAAKNLPAEIRKKHEQIPWKKIIGMRDKLIHDYGGTDVGIVWKSATEDAQSIKEGIKKMMDEMPD